MTIIVDNLIFFAFIIFHCEHCVQLAMAMVMVIMMVMVIFHCEQLQVVQDSGVSPPWLLWAPSHKRTYMMERRILVTRTLMMVMMVIMIMIMMMMVVLMIIGMIMTEEVGTLQRRFVQLSI